MTSLRLYFRYLGISVRSQMQYPGSFLMMTAGHFFTVATEFLAIWALFARFGSIRGWTLPAVALFYGITNCAFALGEGIGRGFDVFSDLVKSGDFDRLLLRPRSTALQVAGQELQLMRVGRLAQALIVLFWGAANAGVSWTPLRVGVIAGCILGGACIFYGLFIFQATLSFWTIETLEVMNTMTYGGIETAQYPLTVYRPWFRRFFTFVVPLACVNYLPVSAVLNHGQPAGVPTLVLWLAPLGGFLFLLVALRVWSWGVRHYLSTGS